MKSFLVTALALTLGGCVSATVKEPSACDDQSISFPVPTLPTIPAEYASATTCSAYASFSTTVPKQTQTVTLDLSGGVSKLQNVTNNLQLQVTELALNNSQGEFNWVSGVELDITGTNLPQVELATYTMSTSSDPSQLSFKPVLSTAELLNYLSAGPVTITVTLAASTINACQVESLLASSSAGLTSDVSLCVSGSGSFSKSLN